MATISEDKMIKKFNYLSNNTKSAQDRQLPEKEVLCVLCHQPVTLEQVQKGEAEAVVRKNKEWEFFHRACYEDYKNNNNKSAQEAQR